MDEDKFLEMTNCRDCPCLNNDYEQGGSCNWGYETDLYWTEIKSPYDLVIASFDCGLEIVKHSQGEYKPVKVMARKKRTESARVAMGATLSQIIKHLDGAS